jgi:hypothetical protein
MKPIERKQLLYLQQKKLTLVDNFIGAAEEINDQIKEVKSGRWLKEISKGENENAK